MRGEVARAIAHSPLNKCAWSSADPNWGRLLAAAGYSGVEFDPARVRISIPACLSTRGGCRFRSASRWCLRMGCWLLDSTGPPLTQAMSAREYAIAIDLGEGDASCSFLTCDLTEEYVRINADYST